MRKPDHNQDPPQQCRLHHHGDVHVRRYSRFLLQHPHGGFWVHEITAQHVPTRNRRSIQPEGTCSHGRLHLHREQKGNTSIQASRAVRHRPTKKEPSKEWICPGPPQTVPLSPPHVGPRFFLVVDNFVIKYTRKADANHLLKSLWSDYEITEYWTGEKYFGLTL